VKVDDDGGVLGCWSPLYVYNLPGRGAQGASAHGAGHSGVLHGAVQEMGAGGIHTAQRFQCLSGVPSHPRECNQPMRSQIC
jgi:hypothetical protein